MVFGSQRSFEVLVVVLPERLLCRLSSPRDMALFVFGGQTSCEEISGEDMRRVAEAVKAEAGRCGWPIDEVHVCYPPESTGRKWAIYVPTEAQVAEHRGEYWDAERATTNVPRLAGDLYRSAGDAWRLVDEAAARKGQVLLAGFSNGAIVATEYATTHPERVRGLLLLSGLPASVQQWSVRTGQKAAPPTCLTCGSWERYFGGRAAFDVVARDFAADLVLFEGGHCHEKSATLQDATRRVLR